MPIANIPPPQAHRLYEDDADAVLIDVRSKMEFDYVGHPIGAIHMPWAEFPDWSADPARFVARVRERLAAMGGPVETRPLLLLCRSGARSMAAAQALAGAGFTRLYNVAEGFEGDKDAASHRGNLGGWRFHGLPWEQT
jgi:rhodanese-related sulfurtransferase